MELTAAGLHRIRTCFPFHSHRRTGGSSTICDRKSTAVFLFGKIKNAFFFAVCKICRTFAPLLTKAQDDFDLSKAIRKVV